MNRVLKILERPTAVYMVVSILVIAYWLIRMIAFTALSDDEAEQVLFAQSLSLGYDVSNPPLYTWLLTGLFALFGKSIGLVLGFKFFILANVYFALYLAARMSLGRDRQLDAVLVALSPLLIFFVSWNAIFSYSHSLLNALLVILTYIAFLKVLGDGRLRWYGAFGLMIGLGILTKYSYVLFLAGLLVAGLSLSDVRRRVLSSRMLVSIGAAFLVIAPHVWWLAGSMEHIRHAVNYKLQISSDVPYIAGVAKGLWNIVRAMFAFMTPLWIVLALIFPAAVWPFKARADQSVLASLLGRTFLSILVIMAAMVVAGGMTQFRPNYLFLMILFPVWVFLRVPLESDPGKGRRIYAMSVLAGALLSVGGLTLKAAFDPIWCKRCEYFVPYENIALELQSRGFTGGTLFATWYPVPLAGNLALYLDDARTVSKKFVAVRPPARATVGQCLSLWVPIEQGGPDSENAIGSLEGNFDVKMDARSLIKRHVFALHRNPAKHLLIDYVLLDPGSGDCK